MSGRWDGIRIDRREENIRTLFWSIILIISIILAFAFELMESGN